jgi:hypothetical protein
MLFNRGATLAPGPFDGLLSSFPVRGPKQHLGGGRDKSPWS